MSDQLPGKPWAGVSEVSKVALWLITGESSSFFDGWYFEN